MSAVLPAVIDDVDLDKVLQAAAAAITGLPGDLVRPRYQDNPPTRPERNVNWCAIAHMSQTPDDTPLLESVGEDPGQLQSTRHARLDVLASFYGPKGETYAEILKDGIWIPQNMEALQANEIYLQDTGAIVRASEKINQQWIQRYDFPLTFKRKIVRLYPVERFKTVNAHFFDDHAPGKPFFEGEVSTEPPTKP